MKDKSTENYFVVLIEEGPKYNRREKELLMTGDWDKVFGVVSQRRHIKPVLLYASKVSREEYFKKSMKKIYKK